MNRIWLLRHGEPVGGVRYRGSTDDRLSATGWRQMERAIETCGTFERVVASPLRRCADFAQALATHRRVPLVIEPRFRELHFGRWEGRTVSSLMQYSAAALRRFWTDPVAHPPPEAETLEHFFGRVLDGWRAQTARGRDALLIVHGGTVRAILGHVRGLPLRDLLRLEVPYASVHELRIAPDPAECSGR